MKRRKQKGRQKRLYGWVMLLLTALLISPALSRAQEDLEHKVAAGTSFFDKKIDHPALQKFRSHLHWFNPLSYGGADEAFSLFNPVGHLFDPLEEAVPGLLIKGLVRNRSLYKLRGGMASVIRHGWGGQTTIIRPPLT